VPRVVAAVTYAGTLLHVGVSRGQPHPHAGRNGDHRRRLVLASALSSADTVEASTDPVIRIRAEVANLVDWIAIDKNLEIILTRLKASPPLVQDRRR
jgi:hypothetical protein